MSDTTAASDRTPSETSSGTRTRWVVFDYGEVISRRTRALAEIAAMLGVDEVEQAYFAAREAYDRGCSDLEYWRAVGARVGAEVDTDLAGRLTATDVDGWLETDPDSLRLLDELHEQRVPLALLSNAPSSFARAAEQQPWARRFDRLIFSGDLELAKPDAEIWRTLLGTIGAAPDECVFFDDRRYNIDGARQAGLVAELWHDADHARRILRQHGLLAA